MNSFSDTNVAAATHLLNDRHANVSMAARHNPYGDGQAARRIVEELLHG